MSPTSTVTGYTISDLVAVVNALLELPGGVLEIEVPTGPVAGAYVNKRVTPDQLGEYLQSLGYFTPETATLVRANAGTGQLQFEAYTGLTQAQVEGMGLAIVTASGVTHTLLANLVATYDSQTGWLLIDLPPGTAPGDVVSVHLYRPVGGQEYILSEALNPFGSGGGLPPGAVLVNAAAVPAAKRIQVVTDIASSVNGGGQAMIQESDTSYTGKYFKDNRTANAPYFYQAIQEANPSTGATELWWNRFRIQ